MKLLEGLNVSSIKKTPLYNGFFTLSTRYFETFI